MVTPYDGTQRGVRLHGRASDADPFAFHQIVPGDEGQYPAEDLVMYLVRQAAPRLRQPAMIRDLVAARQSQELPQRPRIRTAPDNPAFAVDALEIADQQHAEIAARRQRRGSHPRRIIGLARLLDKAIAARLAQQLLEDRKSTRLNSSH